MEAHVLDTVTPASAEKSSKQQGAATPAAPPVDGGKVGGEKGGGECVDHAVLSNAAAGSGHEMCCTWCEFSTELGLAVDAFRSKNSGGRDVGVEHAPGPANAAVVLKRSRVVPSFGDTPAS